MTQTDFQWMQFHSKQGVPANAMQWNLKMTSSQNENLRFRQWMSTSSNRFHCLSFKMVSMQNSDVPACLREVRFPQPPWVLSGCVHSGYAARQQGCTQDFTKCSIASQKLNGHHSMQVRTEMLDMKSKPERYLMPRNWNSVTKNLCTNSEWWFGSKLITTELKSLTAIAWSLPLSLMTTVNSQRSVAPVFPRWACVWGSY